jgi:hypothetical protein
MVYRPDSEQASIENKSKEVLLAKESFPSTMRMGRPIGVVENAVVGESHGSNAT